MRWLLLGALLASSLSDVAAQTLSPTPLGVAPNATLSIQTGEGSANGLTGINIVVRCALASTLRHCSRLLIHATRLVVWTFPTESTG
jgi:hypothetical protein